jgi:hypothetical protein
MKITKLRNKDGSAIESNQVLLAICKLEHAFAKAGFITNVTQASSSSIRIGLHMKSFVIDIAKLGYNARINTITLISCKTGYKRTNVPTWTQWEEFNHIVNNVLDALKLRANIKSGDYVVRSFESGRVNHWDMPEPFHNGYRLEIPSVLEIVPMKYADDAVQWVGIYAPFIGAVPETTPKGLPRKAKLKLVKAA